MDDRQPIEVTVLLLHIGCETIRRGFNKKGATKRGGEHIRLKSNMFPDTISRFPAINGALAARPDAAFATHARFASRYAALSTEHHGAAASMPGRHDVEERFDDS